MASPLEIHGSPKAEACLKNSSHKEGFYIEQAVKCVFLVVQDRKRIIDVLVIVYTV